MRKRQWKKRVKMLFEDTTARLDFVRSVVESALWHDAMRSAGATTERRRTGKKTGGRGSPPKRHA